MIPANSQISGDYISVYELVEWARVHYPDLSTTTNELNQALGNNNLSLYRHNKLTNNITKTDKTLKQALDFVVKNNGYEVPFFDNDIPF